MAVTQEDRTAKLTEKRQEFGELELRHTVPPGTRKMLGELMRWHDIEEIGEAVQLLVLNTKASELPPPPPRVIGKSDMVRHYFRQGMRGRLAQLTEDLGEKKDCKTIGRLIAFAHSIGPEKSSRLFAIPHHEIVIREHVVLNFHNESLRELRSDPGDEYIGPTTI